MTTKRMKSDQVNKNWADTLQYVRQGGTVIVEHYSNPIAQIIPIPQYAYRIEISDDGEIWDLYRDDARGVERTDTAPDKLAHLILTNHLADRRANDEALCETRVLLWKGGEEGLIEDALIVEANLMPNES